MGHNSIQPGFQLCYRPVRCTSIPNVDNVLPSPSLLDCSLDKLLTGFLIRLPYSKYFEFWDCMLMISLSMCESTSNSENCLLLEYNAHIIEFKPNRFSFQHTIFIQNNIVGKTARFRNQFFQRMFHYALSFLD